MIIVSSFQLFTIVTKTSFLDPLCAVINLLQKRNDGNSTAATEGVKNVFSMTLQRDRNIIFCFLSSVNFLRILKYLQSFQEQVVIFSSVIIYCQRKKHWIRLYIPEFISTFFSIIYLIWCIWFTWCKSFTLPPFICFNSPVLNERLPFPEGSSCPPVIPEISRFEMILGCQIFMNFSSGSHFLKLDVKILATSNDIRYVHCSWIPSSLWQ